VEGAVANHSAALLPGAPAQKRDNAQKVRRRNVVFHQASAIDTENNSQGRHHA
jgi:hypothetical protein